MENKDYQIGIVGFGVVGRGIARLFRETVVAIYDPFIDNEAISNWLKNEKIAANLTVNSQLEFHKCDVIVVSVPTPESSDGSCNTSTIDETLAWIEKIKYEGVVLIKSAVVPSEIIRLAKKYISLRLVVSPEYLGESKYFTPFWKYPDPSDMRSHPWQVFGGMRRDTSLCVDVFKRRMSVDCVHMQTDLKTATLCKYAENAFFAMKVTFCNELYDLAELYGVDYNELRECWLADTRINKNHTLVFPKDRGYGGKCFPKDVKGIIADAKKMGYEPELLKSVDKVNEKFRKLNE